MIWLKQVEIYADKFPVKDYYPFNLDIMRNTGCVEFKTPVTFFTGGNGTGKSTLLTAIAKRCQIHIWDSGFKLRYERNPYEEYLYRFIREKWDSSPVPGSYFGSQIFSNFAKNLEEWAVNDEKMFDYFGGKSLITQSHGQSLMSYFKSRYQIKGLYFMDEPETALSPESLLELLNLLIKTSKQGHAQFIIATHSPFLLACPDSRILSFDRETIQPVAYEDTSYYKIYKEFMSNPEHFFEN